MARQPEGVRGREAAAKPGRLARAGESGSWYPNIELGFNPSNFDLEGETRDSVEDLVVSSDCEVLTEQGLITCGDPSTYSFAASTVTQRSSCVH